MIIDDPRFMQGHFNAFGSRNTACLIIVGESFANSITEPTHIAEIVSSNNLSVQ